MKYKRNSEKFLMLLFIWLGLSLVFYFALAKERSENSKKLPYTVQVIDITNDRTTTYVANPEVKSDTLYIYDARELWSTSHEHMVE